MLQHPEMSPGGAGGPRAVTAFIKVGLVTTGARAGPGNDNHSVSVPLCHAGVAVPGVWLGSVPPSEGSPLEMGAVSEQSLPPRTALSSTSLTTRTR